MRPFLALPREYPPMSSLSRRRFLQASGRGAVLAGLYPSAWSGATALSALAVPAVPRSDEEPKLHQRLGKDARLIVHTTDPIVLETPLALLAEERITPTSALFVRNCQAIPDPRPAAGPSGWKIALSGTQGGPDVWDAALLQELPQTEVEMVLQCSGNGRQLFHAASPVSGMIWGKGGMGNVRFGGVRLSAILERLKCQPAKGAKYLTAEGADQPAAGKSDFEHSLPLDEVLEKSLLVWQMGGELLPAIHGGPVRLVTPGFYGTMQVKWVTRLRFEDHESDHTSQIPDYRTPLRLLRPGEAFEPSYANSEPNWRMRLKSVVLSPQDDATLRGPEQVIRGVAFSDGEARIEAVLVSLDRGATWRRAELTVPDSPYAWYPWHLACRLAEGRQAIWVRAIDAQGRTQPLDGNRFWNPKGYAWNGVEQIEVTVV